VASVRVGPVPSTFGVKPTLLPALVPHLRGGINEFHNRALQSRAGALSRWPCKYFEIL